MSTLTQAQLDSVAGLPSREAAKKLGVSKSTVNKYRDLARGNGGFIPREKDSVKASLATSLDGSLEVETTGSVPQTKAEVDQVMVSRGFDPEAYDFTYRFSQWEAASGENIITMYACRAGAVPKRGVPNAAALDVTELLDSVRDWNFTPVIREKYSSADAVLGFADPQIGKVDANGGSAETVNQVLQSYANFVEVIKEEKPTEVLFADAGDGLENFYNTSSQRETNDLDLTGQVRVLRRIQAEGLRMIRPYCKVLTHASAPSNHGGVRIGPQQQASTASNDWGLEVSHQLQDVFGEVGSDILFRRPNGDHALSLSHKLASGTSIGLTHGDQSAQARMGAWWMGQAFGWDNPLRDVDILVYGHHHNQSIDEIYEGRWAIGLASSDRGSAWFTNKTGRSASSGMTMFLTAGHKFWGLDLI